MAVSILEAETSRQHSQRGDTSQMGSHPNLTYPILS